MAYDVSALTNYTREFEDGLVLKSLFEGKTQKLIQAEGKVMTGVKSSAKIELLDTDAIFQSGGSCGFTSSGTTAFTERTVTVGKIKVNESLCIDTLESKATQKALQIGSANEKIPFEQEYSNQKAGKIGEQVEVAIWQGNTDHGNANLNKFDGLIKILDASGVTIAANSASYISGAPIAAATGITLSNVKSIVTAMWLALPAALQGKDDIRVFAGWDTFNKFISAFTDLNLFNFAPTGSEVSAANGVVIIPGTNYKLTAVHGLDGTNRLFALRMSNVVLATDLENEEEAFKIFFAEEADEARFIAKFKIGVNVGFPSEVVSFKLV